MTILAKMENILGDSVQKRIDRDATRNLEPNPPAANQGPPRCRFCGEIIKRHNKLKVYAWEVQNSAHVNCATKHQDDS